MTEPSITVTYERKLSDGNYGSEGMSLTWTGPYRDDDESIASAYIQVAHMLRRQVLELLARSAAERVAYTAAHELNSRPQRAVPAGVADEDSEDLPF